MHLIILYPPSPTQTVFVCVGGFTCFLCCPSLSLFVDLLQFRPGWDTLYLISTAYWQYLPQQCVYGVGVLCIQQVLTLQTFSAWSEDVHVVWTSCSLFFLHFLTRVNLVHFASIIYIEWVSSVCNSFYRFGPICLKLCWHFLQGLRMCMKSRSKPHIYIFIFCRFYYYYYYYYLFILFSHKILSKYINSTGTLLTWSFLEDFWKELWGRGS